MLQSLVLHEGEGETNEFIAARTRGGLVTPCENIVRILHEAEICFRKDVKKQISFETFLLMQSAF